MDVKKTCEWDWHVLLHSAPTVLERSRRDVLAANLLSPCVICPRRRHRKQQQGSDPDVASCAPNSARNSRLSQLHPKHNEKTCPTQRLTKHHSGNQAQQVRGHSTLEHHSRAPSPCSCAPEDCSDRVAAQGQLQALMEVSMGVPPLMDGLCHVMSWNVPSKNGWWLGGVPMTWETSIPGGSFQSWPIILGWLATFCNH